MADYTSKTYYQKHTASPPQLHEVIEHPLNETAQLLEFLGSFI
ncbi:hypothetical protein [uncultured Cyclobacterium sp.]